MTEKVEVDESVAAVIRQHRILPCVPVDPPPSKGMDCSAMRAEDLKISESLGGKKQGGKANRMLPMMHYYQC